MSKTIAASLVIAGAMLAGNASALTLDEVSNSTNLNVVVKDGVATLFGHVETQFESIRAEAAAGDIEGVDEVRNTLTFSN